MNADIFLYFPVFFCASLCFFAFFMIQMAFYSGVKSGF